MYFFRTYLPPTFVRAFALMSALAVVSLSPAATRTWTGNSGADWATAGNWNTGAPASGDSVIFSGSKNLASNVGSGSWNWDIASITFASGAGAFSLNSGGLNIGSGGVTNNSANTQTINSQTVLTANQTWTANTGAIVTGNSYFNANSKNLTLAGSKDITMAGQIGNVANLTITGSGNRTFTNTVQTTSSGVVNFNGTGTTTFTQQLNAGTVNLTSGTTNFAAVQNVNGGINISGTASATFNGDVAANSSGININTTGNIVFNGKINSGALTLNNGNVRISGSGDNDLPSAVVNGGTLTLDQSGGRAIIHDITVNNGGTVKFEGNSQVPSGGTSLTLNEGGTLYLGNTNQTFQSLNITGDSVIDFGSSGSQLNVGSGGITIANNITITIVNWNSSMGDVFAGANPGNPVVNVQYADSSGNIYASGTWGSGYITPGAPVPEPATYGLLMLGAGVTFVGCRRRSRAVVSV